MASLFRPAKPTLTAESLLPGDHLWVQCTGYSHHGLYLGDGRVAHYAGWVEGFRAGPLVETSLDEFRDGRRLHRRHHARRTYSRAESVERARSRLGENRYNVHANNCEHFCYWAIHGEHHSRQMDWVDLGLGLLHPGLEATRKTLGRGYRPDGRDTVTPIIGQLVLDWGVKSAARWATGPYGLAVYASYRLGRSWLSRRRQKNHRNER
ncbi:lecithin retinol acyltransferase family protein [Saccharospirillum mangrovi]|uniref:lecithin retinol acyltransferase family protein n=1 Tax=Saccharospirillum mangrovi TaxID=2161747 RepID=UPI000D3B8444|nr:lecithin retinol acyltransferase family protein [Saccharospirillum mangrovi]